MSARRSPIERGPGATVVSYRNHAHGVLVTITAGTAFETHKFSIHLNDSGVAAPDGSTFFNTSTRAQQAADELLKARGHFCVVAGCPDWRARSPLNRVVH
jgi:hypothetical protein